jgi:hypothetical protein
MTPSRAPPATVRLERRLGLLPHGLHLFGHRQPLQRPPRGATGDVTGVGVATGDVTGVGLATGDVTGVGVANGDVTGVRVAATHRAPAMQAILVWLDENEIRYHFGVDNEHRRTRLGMLLT